MTEQPSEELRSNAHVHLQVITTSELSTLRDCKRKHHLSYRLGFRPISPAGPLRFGIAMHNAWEIWWSPATLGNLDLALERIDAAGEIDEFERARARAMMIAYHCRWLEAPYEILAIEQEFRAPLINPRTGHASKTYVVGGKIDAIIRMPNGDVWIVE